MNAPEQLKSILEAALLAAGKTLSLEQMSRMFTEGGEPDRETLSAALEALRDDYEGRGMELKQVASGYRIQVRADYSQWVSRLWEEKPGRYSRALMETLALIAYRQPITRGEIEEIRGVAVNTYIIKTLMEREWVRVVGHRDVPGRPSLYATTRTFLDYFGLKSLDGLPTLAEIRDLEEINRELDLREDTPPAGPEGIPIGDEPTPPASDESSDADAAEDAGDAGPARDGDQRDNLNIEEEVIEKSNER